VSTKTKTSTAKATADAGRARQRLRTRRLLLATAARLIETGGWPTVAEVADAAEVSRRTAYRYFPTQAKMFVEAALEGLRPVMEAALAATPSGATTVDLETRVDRLVVAMQRLASENEHLLRMMIHLTVLEPASGKQPRRGSRRIDWIESALQPMRARLSEGRFQRLVSALAVAAGIESLVVLRDIRGLPTQQAVDTSRWIARSLVRQALADEKAARARKRKT